MGLFALLLYLTRSMFNLILVTFILTYLMDRFQVFISRKLDPIVRIDRRAIIGLLYLIFVGGITYTLYRYLPVISIQIGELVVQVQHFLKNPPDNAMVLYVVELIGKTDFSSYMKQGADLFYQYVANIGKVGVQFLLSVILSLFFLLEKPRIIQFTSKFKDSYLAVFYTEIAYFGRKFANSFGKVIEAQFLIAVVNCVLSVIALWVLDFPQLIGLGIMIFLLGLIPVAGVIISLFPLCMIAYNVGGFIYIVYILVYIAVIHAIEAYVLNPKFMSVKTNLPIFYTFIVLIFSEHFLGVWGLIIGIPIFIFLLDVFEVTTDEDEKDETTNEQVG
ncbi:putative PurR-regulated permease PerM [Priestia taiwanensis]|uniref:AI-2E family transporter n=1 Tax=Priestia taiwanensis TaxID=1347902 RepID=A0A917AW94_9BACI|nr:putative PurR-regulated permease PerM [Priestia taiwanensis]GGE82747.1 AI-2E family transporter [Priestia taiwanensis]